jgi:hypothetical protein
MIRMLPIVPAGYGIGAYNKTAPITIRTTAKISKFRCEIAVKLQFSLTYENNEIFTRDN